MSRNFTYMADNKNDTPSANINNSIMRGIISNHSNDGVIPLNNAKINTTIKLNPRLISAEKELDTTIKYLGILIFLIKSPLATIEAAPIVVDSTKKFHITIPRRR